MADLIIVESESMAELIVQEDGSVQIIETGEIIELAGPSAISSDDDNVLSLGSDGLLYLGSDQFVSGTGITQIVSITQANYDLIAEPDPSTLYVIVNN